MWGGVGNDNREGGGFGGIIYAAIENVETSKVDAESGYQFLNGNVRSFSFCRIHAENTPPKHCALCMGFCGDDVRYGFLPFVLIAYCCTNKLHISPF